MGPCFPARGGIGASPPRGVESGEFLAKKTRKFLRSAEIDRKRACPENTSPSVLRCREKGRARPGGLIFQNAQKGAGTSSLRQPSNGVVMGSFWCHRFDPGHSGRVKWGYEKLRHKPLVFPRQDPSLVGDFRGRQSRSRGRRQSDFVPTFARSLPLGYAGEERLQEVRLFL